MAQNQSEIRYLTLHQLDNKKEKNIAVSKRAVFVISLKTLNFEKFPTSKVNSTLVDLPVLR